MEYVNLGRTGSEGIQNMLGCMSYGVAERGSTPGCSGRGAGPAFYQTGA